MQDIYILAGARTPVGVLQGLVSDVSAIHNTWRLRKNWAWSGIKQM